MLGTEGRNPSAQPFDRRTGTGRIDARPGQYADALAKGYASCDETFIGAEMTGALYPGDTAAYLTFALTGRFAL